MGLLSKLKKPLGAKLIKKDPIGSKVLGKSKGAQAMGLVSKAAAKKVMNTGGNNRPTAMGVRTGPATGGAAARRMDALQRPQGPGSRLRRTP